RPRETANVHSRRLCDHLHIDTLRPQRLRDRIVRIVRYEHDARSALNLDPGIRGVIAASGVRIRLQPHFVSMRASLADTIRKPDLTATVPDGHLTRRNPRAVSRNLERDGLVRRAHGFDLDEERLSRLNTGRQPQRCNSKVPDVRR